MLTKVVAGLLAFVAVGFAGTSLYHNHNGKCPLSGCTGDASCQSITESSDSSCCQSQSEEGACCSLRSRILLDGVDSGCCQQQAKAVVSAKTVDDEIDPWE